MPTACASDLESDSEARGPVAMTIWEKPSSAGSSSEAISRSTTRMLGSCRISSVSLWEKALRSTASALPAGTRVASAAAMKGLAKSRSSCLSRPMPLASSSLRREFEQTSSEKLSALCAGDRFPGFCSKRVTGTPERASTLAHSQPARPAPTMATLGSDDIVCMDSILLVLILFRVSAQPYPRGRFRPGTRTRASRSSQHLPSTAWLQASLLRHRQMPLSQQSATFVTAGTASGQVPACQSKQMLLQAEACQYVYFLCHQHAGACRQA